MPQEMVAIYDTLTETNKQSVLSYMAFLANAQQNAKESQIENAFAKINELMANENPWNSENEMLEEMADFRRKRLGLLK